MPTTTNFGWTTPADTDLVKDGAAAIRTLGNGVDTSLVDLKGGTTGQILSKASNADLDYTWINNDTGDITGVTAGTGISGGGTSGTVTITNSMATEITAAGDIIVGTGSGTFDNLPIGTTGQVLTADTTVSPYKVKWATAGTSYNGVDVYKSATQSISNSTDTAITWDLEGFDTNSYHSTTTNTARFTVPSGGAGKYLLTGNLNWAGNSTGLRAIKIYKNGSFFNESSLTTGGADGIAQPISWVYDLAVGDYLEIYGRQSSGGNLNVDSGTGKSRMQLTFLGA